MASTASGVTIPGADPTLAPADPIEDLWNDLGKSLNGKLVVPVASITARAALVIDLVLEGYSPSTAHPIYTTRADATPGCELEVTTDGTTWKPIGRPMIGTGGAMVGGAPPAGAAFVEQAGRADVTTNASGDVGIPYPTPFSNGVLAVKFHRYDFSGSGPTVEIENTVQTLTQFNFRVYVPSTGAALPTAGLSYVYHAIGW